MSAMRGRWSMIAGSSVNDKLFWLTVLGLIGFFTAIHVAYSVRAVPPWDSSAMVILGKLIAQGRGIQYYDIHNAQIGPYFNPHGFTIRSPVSPQPFSVFPPGFSLIVAPVYGLTGNLDYLYLISPIVSIAGFIAIAYIGYQLSGRWGSIFAVALIGTSYAVTDSATALWSDGSSLAIFLVSVALYIHAIASDREIAAFLSGLCLGLFVSLKFVNVIFAGMLLAHLVVTGNGRRRWVMAMSMAPGVLLGVSGMLIYQAQAYGGPLANAFQAWGSNRFTFPLFSLKYLFEKSPPPWNDFSANAIVAVLLSNLHLWSGLALVGLMIDRRNRWRLLLALVLLLNILIYAVSVFTPRLNARYLLPALAAGGILAADVLARLMSRTSSGVLRAALVGLVGAVCLGNFVSYLPALANRNQGTAGFVRAVLDTTSSLPADSVVLAYDTADVFILYGNLSVLNYRQIQADNIEARNQIVIQAVTNLVCHNKSVYLVKDQESQFNTIYPALSQAFSLQPISTTLPAYRLQLPPETDDCPSAFGRARPSG